jgi:putative protease
MSSLIGGRSGNRGRCAQPCRQVYEINDQKHYAISPKDLNVLHEIDQLIECGVKSLKIEGRMKGPEYAATVVEAYRNQIDHKASKNHLKQIFNRTYTRGYLMSDKSIVASDAPGNRGEYVGKVKSYNPETKRLTIELDKTLHKGDEIQIRRKTSSIGARTDVFYVNNQRVNEIKGPVVEVPFKYHAEKNEKIFRTYDAKWMKDSKAIYEKDPRRIAVKGYIQLMEGQSPFMTLTDGEHEVSKLADMPCEKAKNVALTADKIRNQIQKMGQTAYLLTDLEIDMEDHLAIPMKVLNELRRQCTDALDVLRSNKYDRESHLVIEPLKPAQQVKASLAVSVRSKEQYEAIKDLDIEIYDASASIQGVTPLMSRIKTSQDMDQMKDSFPANMKSVVGNLGSYAYFDETITDFSLNVMNSRSANFLKARVTLSYELSASEINDFRSENPLELIVYGHVPVMIMAYCPITGQSVHCENCHQPCSNHPVIKDRFENKYPMIRTGNRLEILSDQALHLMPYLKELKPIISVYRLSFTIESPEQVAEITKDYLNYLETGKVKQYDHTNSYHFHKGVD